MDPSEQERADRWFREKWRHGNCPVCDANDWKQTPNLGQIENLDTGEDATNYPLLGVAVRRRGRIPVLFIACQNCGYLVAVNALLAGIRQPPQAVLEPPTADSGASSPPETEPPESVGK
jgi:hypothetical protein